MMNLSESVTLFPIYKGLTWKFLTNICLPCLFLYQKISCSFLTLQLVFILDCFKNKTSFPLVNGKNSGGGGGWEEDEDYLRVEALELHKFGLNPDSVMY